MPSYNLTISDHNLERRKQSAFSIRAAHLKTRWKAETASGFFSRLNISPIHPQIETNIAVYASFQVFYFTGRSASPDIQFFYKHLSVFHKNSLQVMKHCFDSFTRNICLETEFAMSIFENCTYEYYALARTVFHKMYFISLKWYELSHRSIYLKASFMYIESPWN